MRTVRQSNPVEAALVDDRGDASASPDHAAIRIARLEERIDVLQAQVASLEAADEHHRVELAAARAETAEAQAQVREAQARAEERGHLVTELRGQLEAARSGQAQAEQERAAVIAALGRRARRRLDLPS